MFPLPRLFALLAVVGLAQFVHEPASAQDEKGKQVADLEKQIAEIQKQIADLKKPAAKKPLTIAEGNTWRAVRGAALSPDGAWFVARIGPMEGDSEVTLKQTKGDKEIKFIGGGGFAPLEFSTDSKWFAITVSPPAPRPGSGFLGLRPAPPKVVLVNLATSDKTEFEGYRTFAFNRDAGTHLVMRKAPAAPTMPTGAPGGGPAMGMGQAPAAPAAAGNDLVIRELATGAELTLGNVNEFSFNKAGTVLAMTIDSAGQIGNGIQVRDMKTGALTSLDSAKATYQGLNWHETADAFAVLRGADDKAVEGKAFSVVGFTDVGPATKKTIFDPKTEASFPKGLGISTNRSATWSDDLGMLMFGIADQKRVEEPKKEEPKKEGVEPKKDGPMTARPTPPGGAKPDLVIWHWKDERLQSQQQVQAGMDKTFSYACVYRVKDKKFLRLGDDTVRNVDVAPKQKFAIGIDEKAYQLMSTLDGKEFADVYVTNLETGERKKALTKVRWNFGVSPTGAHYLYHEDGHFRTLDLATLKVEVISAKAETSFINSEDDHNVDKPPTRTIGWTADGKFVLASDNWDIWQLAADGSTATNLTGDGKAKGIRYRGRVSFDIREKGADLSKPMIVAFLEERTKKSGYAKIEPGKPGANALIVEDAAIGALSKAKNAETYVYTRQTNEEYSDYYLTDATLKAGKRMTTANPQQMNYLWSAGAKLIDYTSLNGQKLQAALYLPANYQPGQRYPTITYIYEKLTDQFHFYQLPGTGGGFNKSIYTSNGYAVLMPDIKYQLNDPGVSAVKCILPALDAAIATGIVDPAKVALHGHSWGGYQTAYLVTQTDRFKAAIAGAPLTDLISMYSSIYWNAGIANQPIFESSQGRFTGGYWEQQEAYIRNSPVYHARNVTTPLVILHNDKDGAVDFTQGIEYFNTLRRLQKPVVMLQYKGENHGLVKPENRKDYAVRMREFFDHYLMGKPAPDWWTEGVPHLKMEEHLKGRKE